MATFVYEHFSKFQSGSRKRYNIPQCLIALIEKWKSVVDSWKYFGALLVRYQKLFIVFLTAYF